MEARIHPAILSGGAGNRLWPLSRETLPKQFLPLHGKRTMLQNTVERCASLAGARKPIVICNEAHRFLVAAQMQEVGCSAPAIILEPRGRNTAPAAAVAALNVAEIDPQGIVMILPSDHVIMNQPAFECAVTAAVAAAASGRLVTFGIKPKAPETGYGYIHAGGELNGLNGVHAVGRFVEKPDAISAEHYVASGDYFWNSGMFLFRADVFLEELEALQPEILSSVRAALSCATMDLGFVRLGAAAFDAVPSISIDHAVMEKTGRAAVVPCEIGWSDVGAWSALWEISERDDAGNVICGDVIAHDATNCYVRSEGKLTAVVGVEGLAVSVTDDAVLIADKKRAQDVKLVVEQLKANRRAEYSAHAQVLRPWGSFKSIGAGERFQVKEIVVKPGGQLSLQMHHHRAEHWIVVQGTAWVTCGEEVFTLHENQSAFIAMGVKHRLENPGKIPLCIIEVQSGSYLSEDDIVRFEDSYGRP